MAQATYTKTTAPYAHAGIVVGKLTNSVIDMDVNTHFSQLTTFRNTCLFRCSRLSLFPILFPHVVSVLIFLKHRQILIIYLLFSRGVLSYSGSTVGCIHVYTHNQYIKPVNKINSKINTITIHASGSNSFIGTCIGLADSHANIIHLSVNDAYIIGNNVYAGGVVGVILGRQEYFAKCTR